MRKSLIIFLAGLCAVTSCIDDPIVLPWDPVTPVKPDPDPPTPGPDPDPQPEGKPRYVWIDASANFQYYANDKEYIAKDLTRVKEAGFTDVIVDVRPTEGTVLFKSAKAPATKRLAAWVRSSTGSTSYKFVERTADFDYLQAFIDAGHAAGLRVNAAINTFVCGYGGYYGLESEGPIFSGNIPESWATVVNYSDGVRSSFYKGVEGTVFMNPANDNVQEYMLAVIGELASYKDLDGIILDRCRYDDMELGSDFSAESKAKFTEYLGSEPSKWPVFDAGTTSDLPAKLTDEQKAWVSFRAKVIHDFVAAASDKVHGINPKIRFGCYVGAWYSTYYLSGVNWASPKYDTAKKESTYSGKVDANYSSFGYADHCDFMMLGCYAAASSITGSGEWTMQGFCNLGRKRLAGDTEFAGGPDVGNPTGWEKGGQGAKIPATINACINAADGYFVFDLCHIRMYDYWSDFKKGFDEYLNTL